MYNVQCTLIKSRTPFGDPVPRPPPPPKCAKILDSRMQNLKTRNCDKITVYYDAP